ncbi:hypothetical protein PV04_00094 [Phialophora macrospora]|uniref:Uncharacterized protein n=1 Tax=Phialophora macrospora TaxID=1851006 RepID=A0A0D2GHT7_9EURO|nr:hypothetical protein PV04_00094 [Phialophora macrospora]
MSGRPVATHQTPRPLGSTAIRPPNPNSAADQIRHDWQQNNPQFVGTGGHAPPAPAAPARPPQHPAAAPQYTPGPQRTPPSSTPSIQTSSTHGTQPSSNPAIYEQDFPTPTTNPSHPPSSMFSGTGTHSSYTTPSTHSSAPPTDSDESWGNLHGHVDDTSSFMYHDDVPEPDSAVLPPHLQPTAGGSHFPGAYGDHDTSALPAAGGSHFPGAYGDHDTSGAAQHGMGEEEEEDDYYDEGGHGPQHGESFLDMHPDNFLDMDEEHPDNFLDMH